MQTMQCTGRKHQPFVFHMSILIAIVEQNTKLARYFFGTTRGSDETLATIRSMSREQSYTESGEYNMDCNGLEDLVS
ncbi:hypothetical protein ACS0TY_018486 [Phlomoides rotata]